MNLVNICNAASLLSCGTMCPNKKIKIKKVKQNILKLKKQT